VAAEEALDEEIRERWGKLDADLSAARLSRGDADDRGAREGQQAFVVGKLNRGQGLRIELAVDVLREFGPDGGGEGFAAALKRIERWRRNQSRRSWDGAAVLLGEQRGHFVLIEEWIHVSGLHATGGYYRTFREKF